MNVSGPYLKKGSLIINLILILTIVGLIFVVVLQVLDLKNYIGK